MCVCVTCECVCVAYRDSLERCSVDDVRVLVVILGELDVAHV